MTTNPYFNNYNSAGEQNLLSGLIEDSIKQNGIDVKYIFRQVKDFDDLYGEDTISEYDDFVDIEVYVESFEGFTGDNTFHSKFNLEVRDELTIVVSKKRFEEEFDSEVRKRPMEGDIIFFPFGSRPFIIKYVDHRQFFYQLGNLYTYKLTCELWEYSGEKLNTGIEEFDIIQGDASMAVEITGNTNFDVQYDSTADNTEIDTEANGLIDWEETNPFGKF